MDTNTTQDGIAGTDSAGRATFKAQGDTARAAGKWHGGQWIRQDAREALYLRGAAACGGFRCTYCLRPLTRGYRGGSAASLDHVVPASLGGSNAPSNLVVACGDCNRLRNTLPVADFARVVTVLHGTDMMAADVAARVQAQTSVPLTPALRAQGRAALASRKLAGVEAAS